MVIKNTKAYIPEFLVSEELIVIIIYFSWGSWGVYSILDTYYSVELLHTS